MTNKRPNFVFLLTDDQGPWAVPWKMPELVMPNLQELADEGIRFDNFYCASPVCSPARASLLTGRMPSAHGIHDWLVGGRVPQAYPDRYLDDLTTFPAVLAANGYKCGLSGKWHVGDSREPAPGFRKWYVHRYGGGPYYHAPIWREEEEAEEPKYFTEAVGDHAVEFINAQNPDEPFYLHVATTAPHDPWDSDNHPTELLDLYKDCEFESVPREPRHPWTEPRRDDFEHAFNNPEESLRGYCASLTGVDIVLGRIRETLRARGLEENTVILYMADNGFSCGHHGVWGKGNGTYPLNFWENSVRVPFVMYIPPQLRDGVQVSTVNDHLSAVSLFPTVCELAGVNPPEDPLRAGESFTAQMYDQDSSSQPVVIFDEYGGGRMIRLEDWKYIERFDGPAELYNLAQDPEEKENLCDQYQTVREELSARLRQWFSLHQTPLHYAYDKPVRGYGQIHPTWRRDESNRYVETNESHDGVRA
ncbi:MAG: sulfatase-like hydrolase/transferase [Actinomycetaceae bacterium]|nr:sulfatase-like hydrolase/transferase [Actinomycetaceae bacterium]